MSVDGNWKISVESPVGTQVIEASIVSAGATFSGTARGPAGETPLDGQIEGDTLMWSSAITTPLPMTLRFAVKVDGDTMTGSVRLGMLGTAPVTGIRVQGSGT